MMLRAKVLVVENNSCNLNLLKTIEKKVNANFECASTSFEAVDKAVLKSYDLILINTNLNGVNGFKIAELIQQSVANQYTPIIFLSEKTDDYDVLKGVKSGGVDFFEIPFKVELLVEKMKLYLKLFRYKDRLLEQSLHDELTGVYNRRGFTALVESRLKSELRKKHKSMLLFFDLDGLKPINDNLGHLEGDKAIKAIAGVLELSFREGDIIGRLGGDEFGVLPVDSVIDSDDIIINRVNENIEHFNNLKNNNFKLSVSVGISHFDPENPVSLRELIHHADMSMYIAKKAKKDALRLYKQYQSDTLIHQHLF